MFRQTIGQRKFRSGILIVGVLIPVIVAADEKRSLSASALMELDAAVLPGGDENVSQRERMLSDDARQRLREANRRETLAWRKISTRAQWEDYREGKIRALRESLGHAEAAPKPLPVKITGELNGDG
jgi:hypothetical protein